MSVALICPQCGTVATLHRAPVGACPNCQAAWPESLRLSAEATLARQKVGRPLLITVGMYVAPGFGALFLLFLFLIPFGGGAYTVNGDVVSGAEFLREGGLLVALTGTSLLAVGYAIWQERSWSRWAMVVFWLIQVAGAIGQGLSHGGIAEVAGPLASLLLPIVLAWWYLFEKPNVVEYYRALAKQEAAPGTARGFTNGDGA